MSACESTSYFAGIRLWLVGTRITTLTKSDPAYSPWGASCSEDTSRQTRYLRSLSELAAWLLTDERSPVLGIDLAAGEERTYACELTLMGREIHARLHASCDDATLLKLADGCEKVAIDAPFGWPTDFVAAVGAHAARQGWPAGPDDDQEEFRRSLSFRRTDRVVMQTRRPLSVSTDRIGVTAMRCAYLLSRWESEVDVDRAGGGRFVEVYPAAALQRWGLPAGGYKRAVNKDVLGDLLKTLCEALPELVLDDEAQKACADSDDAFDALVASLVGRAALLDLTDGPPSELDAVAAQEGWIHLPLRASLRFLGRSRHELSARPQAALASRLSEIGVNVDEKAYVRRVEDVLLPTFGARLRLAIQANLAGKGGSELIPRDKAPPKFFAAYSSAALAANTFGPFLGGESEVPIAGRAFSGRVALEVECPSKLRGVPPTLDCLVEGTEILAVESKCTETYSRHEARFREAYADALGGVHESWRNEYDRLAENPIRYRYLDAAQLVKHYLGLKTTYAHRHVMLVYLYWEPSNASGLAPCVIHRAEVAEFVGGLADPDVRLIAMSHRELWEEWGAERQPLPLREHAAALRTRYDVAA